MRCALLAFAAGIAYLQTFAALPAVITCVVLALVCLVLMVLLRLTRSRRPDSDGFDDNRIRIQRPFAVRGAVRGLAAMIVAAIAGMLWATWCAYLHLGDRLSPEWEGRNITLIGTIESLPTMSSSGQRFMFHVERVLPASVSAPIPASVPEQLSLSWFARGAKAMAAMPHLQPGARWQFTVRLTRPHGNANPYGFDYELWLFERHIGATGNVRVSAATPARLLDSFVLTVPHLLERMRGSIQRRILAALPAADAPHAGVIVALVIGEQRAISTPDWDVFRRTGISHLVAISGMHIMMVAAVFGRLMLALWRRSFWLPRLLPDADWCATPLPLRVPAQKVAMLAALLAAALYVALAGFGVPAQRTLYMFAVITMTFWCGRSSSASHILCLAMALVLLVDPWALLWPGFQLSFATVAIILYAGSGRVRAAPSALPRGIAARDVSWRRRWPQLMQATAVASAEAMRAQGAVTLGLLPLTMLLFSQYSLVGPAANALAIPVVTLLVAPLALLGSVLPEPIGTPVLWAAHGAFSLLSIWLEWLSALPLAIWRAPLPSWPVFLIALAGTLLMLAPRGWPLRAAGLCGWLPLLCNTASHPPPGAMWVTAFDIGQGMAVLVETAQHRLLYDTGPPYGPNADAGQRVILPYLQARGITRLDAMVVSHADSDHAGGARSLLAALPVMTMYSSLPLNSAIVRAAAHPVRCARGQDWQWDGIRFEMLQPAAAVYAGDAANSKKINGTTNARSCTLKISTATHAMLLPGDIGVAQEQALVRELGRERLRADVLLAPHHGSRTSSSPAFLQAVDPSLAIFQVGYRNRYHHPQAAVYRRYQNFGIQRLRTDESGAIALQFGAALEYGAYRQQYGHYWQHLTPIERRD